MELLGLTLSTANLNPKEIGGTASARQFNSGFQALIESADILEARKSDMNPLRRGEQELWELLKRWHNWMFDMNILRDDARSFGKFSEDFQMSISFADVKPMESEKEVLEIIDKAIPSSARQRGGHSGKRTFQAIRMEVNQELSNLKIALEKITDRLEIGGRVAIISYHSLEDKIVKDWMKKEEIDCVCPPDIPVCVCDKRARLSRVSRKPIRPKDEEISRNPRSRSAKLRVAERV